MIQNTILILSQDTQERIAQESLLRQISLFQILSLFYKTEAKQNFVGLTVIQLIELRKKAKKRQKRAARITMG